MTCEKTSMNLLTVPTTAIVGASGAGFESNQQPAKQSKGFQCNQCDLDFKTEKIHKGRSHKEVPSPEKMWKSSTQPSLPCFPHQGPGQGGSLPQLWHGHVPIPQPTTQLFVDVAVGPSNAALATMS